MEQPSYALNRPHGGVLINKVTVGEERQELLNKSKHLKKVEISDWVLSDLETIATGGFSPVNGFFNKDDYLSTLDTMHLTNGFVWSIPITLAVTKEQARNLRIGSNMVLAKNNTPYALMTIEDKYEPEKKREALSIYGTTEIKHPGVKRLFESGEVYLGGSIKLIDRPPYKVDQKFFMTPLETRVMFQSLGWKTVAGFQTRNPVHRAHEYIQKCALESVDGLFIHPLVGETKSDDIPNTIRMKSYEALLANYYPKNRARLAVYPGSMRYAGPKEAILHALVRKNYGCTHFIVGRDHAGVGNYYGTYASQNIFNQFSQQEMGIEILKFEHSFYCLKCQSMATAKTCPHDDCDHLVLSGTKVREMLRNGETLPPEFSRPEVVKVLLESLRE